MVTVALDTCGKVCLVMLAEILVIILQTLRFQPLVEGLVDDEHAQPVAGLIKAFRCQIMGTTDGIETILFQQFHTVLVGTCDSGGTQQTIVVVDAATLQQHRLAVQLKALLGRNLNGADAERNLYPVGLPARLPQADHCRVQPWRVYRPKLGLLDVQRSVERTVGRRRVVLIENLLAVGRDDADPDGLSVTRSVNECGEADGRPFLVYLLGRHVGVPFVEMGLCGLDQPHVTVQARTDVPATVVSFVDTLHRNHIPLALRFQVLGDVHPVGGVGIAVEIDLMAVHPYLRLIGGGFYV